MITPYNVIFNEIPDPGDMEPNEIYIESEDGEYFQAAMICCCGCNEVLYMNLCKQIKPCWSVEIDKDGLVTFIPSINRIVGCKSHFWIRNGVIQWA